MKTQIKKSLFATLLASISLGALSASAATEYKYLTVLTENVSLVACPAGEPSTSLCLSGTGTGTFANGTQGTVKRSVTLKDYSTSTVTGCAGVASTSVAVSYTSGGSTVTTNFLGMGTYCKSDVGTRLSGSAQYIIINQYGQTFSLYVSPPTYTSTGATDRNDYNFFYY